MSKKKKKKVQPKPINKRLRAIICICAAAALLLGGLLTWYLLTKEKPLIVQYNGAMTAKAQREGYLSANEVIIVHTVDDSAGGFVQLHCYIYQVPEHVSTKRMLKTITKPISICLSGILVFIELKDSPCTKK